MKTLTIRQQTNRINKYMSVATSEEYKKGLNWYKDARELCLILSAKYGNTLIQVAQVISVLSPQKKWATNKKEVVSLYSEVFDRLKPNFSYFATKKQIEECKQIMKGEFSIPPKRIKTYSFADNIANSASSEVTIDRHALRVAYDDKTSSIDKVTLKQYREARESYRFIANQYGLEAYEVQAITWLVYKRIVNR
jgi:hypothetical protein